MFYNDAKKEDNTMKTLKFTAALIFIMSFMGCGSGRNFPTDITNAPGGSVPNNTPQQVATPTMDPASGTYSQDISVAISTTTAGAIIYYTTDGSDPTPTSTLYSAPIDVIGNGTQMTIKAIAVMTDMTDSAIATESYTINYFQVSTPSIFPPSGAIISGTQVTVTCLTPGADIYYTTNGSTPDQTSPLYDPSNPPTVTTAITFSAKAFKTGFTDSDTATEIYTIQKLVSHFAGPNGGPGADDGVGVAASFYRPEGIATDGTNLYVADTNNHTIRQIVIATGVVTTLAGSPGLSGPNDGPGAIARFTNPYGITTNGTDLYVADTYNHTIRKIDIASGNVSTFAGVAGASGTNDGIGAIARFKNPRGITMDATYLYVADTNNYTIRKIDLLTANVITIAGTAGLSGPTDGIGTAARFKTPSGITTDGAGLLYVADTGNHTIRQVVVSSKAVTTIAGAAGVIGSNDGLGTAARFKNPSGITTDGTYLYIVDKQNQTIRQMLISTGYVSTLAGFAGLYGSTDGVGSNARFYLPDYLTTDGTNLYVVDTYNNSIRKIIIAGADVSTYAGAPQLTGSSDGVGANARFLTPMGVTNDGTNLYVADYNNHTIRKIDIATGSVSTFAGTAGVVGTANGIGAAASFYNPWGITSDGINLYVADTNNNTIRQINIASGMVSTLAGTAGLNGSNDGIGAAARFYHPSGITTDGTYLYVAEYLNHTIRRIDIASASVITIAGSATVSGFNDGVGSNARFKNPASITTDGSDLYIADDGNHTIRKIILSTNNVITFSGTAGAVGFVDGIGAAARFYNPRGIIAHGGNLYVADGHNNAIRQIDTATGQVTTLTGTGRYGRADGAWSIATFYYPQGIDYVAGSLFVTESYDDIRKIAGI